MVNRQPAAKVVQEPLEHPAHRRFFPYAEPGRPTGSVSLIAWTQVQVAAGGPSERPGTLGECGHRPLLDQVEPESHVGWNGSQARTLVAG